MKIHPCHENKMVVLLEVYDAVEAVFVCDSEVSQRCLLAAIYSIRINDYRSWRNDIVSTLRAYGGRLPFPENEVRTYVELCEGRRIVMWRAPILGGSGISIVNDSLSKITKSRGPYHGHNGR